MKKLLLDNLASGPDLLDDLLCSVPEERIDRRFGPSIWTVHEHLDHLVETQEMLVKRLAQVLEEADPVIVPFVPEEEGKTIAETELLPVDRLLALFRTHRAAQMEIIKNATEADWGKPVRHPEYEQYSFAILVRHILLHDGMHFYRIEDLGFLQPEHIRPL